LLPWRSGSKTVLLPIEFWPVRGAQSRNLPGPGSCWDMVGLEGFHRRLPTRVVRRHCSKGGALCRSLIWKPE